MQQFRCPHCGKTAFATFCTDCQAEGIRIESVRSAFHVGRCPRCGHLDDEPCAAYIEPETVATRAWRGWTQALRKFGQVAVKLAARVGESIRPGSVRPR